jgi:hypothetical protein
MRRPTRWEIGATAIGVAALLGLMATATVLRLPAGSAGAQMAVTIWLGLMGVAEWAWWRWAGMR